MFNVLYPDLYVESILDIPLAKLEALGIKAFILDLDNTLTEWNSNKVHDNVSEWLKLAKGKGFKACILSNNGEQRVLAVAEHLDIPFIHRARKPSRKAFYRALELMGVLSSETAVIGDQIFTDVLGGNRSGLFTVLVVPLAKREFMGTKISRAMEMMVLKRLKGRLNSTLEKL